MYCSSAERDVSRPTQRPLDASIPRTARFHLHAISSLGSCVGFFVVSAAPARSSSASSSSSSARPPTTNCPLLCLVKLLTSGVMWVISLGSFHRSSVDDRQKPTKKRSHPKSLLLLAGQKALDSPSSYHDVPASRRTRQGKHERTGRQTKNRTPYRSAEMKQKKAHCMLHRYIDIFVIYLHRGFTLQSTSGQFKEALTWE